MQIDGGTVDRYLAAAWDSRGTDVLLSAGSPPCLRVDGSVQPFADEDVLDEAALDDLLGEMLTAEQRATYRRDLEIDFALVWRDTARVRGNAFHQQGLPAVALRLIPTRVPTFDELLMPTVVRELSRLSQGLVLVTGPTGSGKSTTLAAMAGWINANRACHIVTIEDPIEYVHPHQRSLVNQREVGRDSHSFERALRSALRENPDVVLVGEMRDPESIAITLTLAETGHLVLSTLHTNDASQALDRIVDVFPTDRQAQVRVQLAGSLAAVVAQRLLPRTGGGLVAAYEVLLASSAVRNLIREGKTRQIRNAITTSQSSGMQTLEMSLSTLVEHGLITYDDAVARALHPGEVARAGPTAVVL